MNFDKISILDVDITSISKTALLSYITEKITQKKKIFITTPNPEIILQSQSNQELKKVINNSHIALPDGIGVQTAAHYLQYCETHKPSLLKKLIYGLYCGWATFFAPQQVTDPIAEVISGDQLLQQLVPIAHKKNWKIFLLGGKTGAAEKTKQLLLNTYPELTIQTHAGAKNISQETNNERQQVLEAINTFKPDLLFVAYGAPWQELWISKNRDQLTTHLAMGIGGTLDDLSGLTQATPEKIRKQKLRWLWRLLTQPQRLPRIINAIIIFPYTVFLSTLRDKD